MHGVQAARRAVGLDISDRIVLTFDGDEQLLDAAGRHQDYIAQETLALDVRYEPVSDGFHAGDAATMRAVCAEAVLQHKRIGAHVSYMDREGPRQA